MQERTGRQKGPCAGGLCQMVTMQRITHEDVGVFLKQRDLQIRPSGRRNIWPQQPLENSHVNTANSPALPRACREPCPKPPHQAVWWWMERLNSSTWSGRFVAIIRALPCPEWATRRVPPTATDDGHWVPNGTAWCAIADGEGSISFMQFVGCFNVRVSLAHVKIERLLPPLCKGIVLIQKFAIICP